MLKPPQSLKPDVDILDSPKVWGKYKLFRRQEEYKAVKAGLRTGFQKWIKIKKGYTLFNTLSGETLLQGKSLIGERHKNVRNGEMEV